MMSIFGFARMNVSRLFFYISLISFLTACGADSATAPKYTISGNVTGLDDITGETLVLQMNDGSDLNISTNGTFSFNKSLKDDTDYSVTILSQELEYNRTCTVSNGVGSVSGNDVTNILVACSSETVSIGGTISYKGGEIGTVVLSNAVDTMTIPVGGTSFAFPTKLPAYSDYNVTVDSYTVTSNAVGWGCRVDNGNGTVYTYDVTNISVVCGRDVKLKEFGGYVKISGENQGVITLLYQATDSEDYPITYLDTNNFIVKEGGVDLEIEAYANIVPRTDISYEIKTVLMLDISGSIGVDDDGVTPNNELQQVKDAAKSMIVDVFGNSVMLDNQRIALYVFNGDVIMLQDFTTDHTLLSEKIDNIAQNVGDPNSTNLYGAVYAGLQRWDNQFNVSGINTGFLVVITDGDDSSNAVTIDEVTVLRDADDKLVFTVGLGNISTTANIALNTIGNAGAFTNINFADLGSTLKDISLLLTDIVDSFYYLHFASTSRSGSPTVTLETADNIYVGTGFSLSGAGYYPNSAWGVSPTIKLDGDLNVDISASNNLKASVLWDRSLTYDYNWDTVDDLGAVDNSVALPHVSTVNSANVSLEGIAAGTTTLNLETYSFYAITDTDTGELVPDVFESVTVNVTEVSVEYGTNLMALNDSMILTAKSSLNETPSFVWNTSTQDIDFGCHIFDNGDGTAQFFSGIYDDVCTVSVYESNALDGGTGVSYTLDITVGIPGSQEISVTEQYGSNSW